MPGSPFEVKGALNERKLTQLSATSHSARKSNETDPAPGPLKRDGPPGQGFAVTGLAAASHRQVAISMAKPERDVGGPRRQRQKWRAYTGGHSEQRPFNGA